MTTQQLIDRLFTQLDEWRHLPAYQLERRADIFFAIYMQDIIKGKFKEDIEFLIPEFPVRLGSVDPGIKKEDQYRSYKIDYLAICNKTNRVFLIELKTDTGSRRSKQDWYLESAKRINIKELVKGVFLISAESTSRKKYANLLSKLSQSGWIDKISMKNTSHDYDITVVYIQPASPTPEMNIITFDEIVSYLAEKQDDLTRRFIQSLNKWKINPNQ